MQLKDIKEMPKALFEALKKENISKLRPCQEKAIKAGLFKGNNLVVCTPTASGKTLIAEMAALKKINEGSIAVYVVPLKALAVEKYKQFKKRYKNIRTALSIGSLDSADHYLKNFNLIITTSEKLDSLLRHHTPWISLVKLLIIDEIHLLNDPGRGPTLEILITMLRQQLKDLQVLALSATIGNPEELAGWLNSKLVFDEWRPVKLFEGIYLEGEIDFLSSKKSSSIVSTADNPAVDIALDTIKMGKQAIIFAKTKREAESTAERISENLKSVSQDLPKKILNLEKPTKQCERLSKIISKGIAFHHAGLTNIQREIIEDSFREGIVKIICSTPTLAAGVDLPAFRTILKDLKRYTNFGLRWIPVLEQKQMAGRAGRPSFDSFGEAICIARDENEKEDIQEIYINGEVEGITSKLVAEPNLRTHLLSLISSRIIKTKRQAEEFFESTFWGYQGEDNYMLKMLLGKIIKELEEWKFIEKAEKGFKATPIGTRVSQLYIDPMTAHKLLESIKKSKEIDLNTLSILQAISNTPEIGISGVRVNNKNFDKAENILLKYDDNLLQKYEMFDGIEYETFIASIYLASIFHEWTEEKTEAEILNDYNIRPGEFNVKKDTADWLLYSMEELANILEYKELLKEIKKLRIRMHYGAKEELLNLLRLKNIGKVRARMLFNRGFRTTKYLRAAKIEELSNIIGRKTAENIKEQLG